MRLLDKIVYISIVILIIAYVSTGLYFHVSDDNDVYMNEMKNLDIQVDSIWNDPVDSDEDGFSDKYEKSNAFLNPYQKDVIVEVDYGKSVNKTDFDIVKQRFDKAPIENPDGSEGINLHIIKDDRNLDLPKKMNEKYFRNNYQIHSDYKMKGYYHAYIVDNATSEDEQSLSGFTNTRSHSMVVEQNEAYPSVTQTTFMHELGHNLGLTDDVFNGIDSQKYSIDNYNSVMNYNHQIDFNYNETTDELVVNESSLRYDTELLNEWKIINKNLDDNRPCGYNEIIC